MDKEILHVPEAADDPAKTTGGASRIMKLIWRTIYHVLTDKITDSEALHPDFRNTEYISEELTWYQNRICEQKPPYKVGFPFNDPSILNDCPWIGKFGNNKDKNELPGFKYYFIGFGDPKKKNFGLDEMIEWAKQFPHAKLLHYKKDPRNPQGDGFVRWLNENTSEEITHSSPH